MMKNLNTENDKKIFIVKIIFSFWILYHLIIVVVMPNANSFIGRYYQNILIPYANAIGINMPWSFFSPDPAQIIYMKYRINFEDAYGAEAKESIEGTYPHFADHKMENMRDRRDYCIARYFIIKPEYKEQYFGPWLCRQNPGATSVYMEAYMQMLPNLDTVILKANPPSVTNMNLHNLRFQCPHPEQESL